MALDGVSAGTTDACLDATGVHGSPACAKRVAAVKNPCRLGSQVRSSAWSRDAAAPDGVGGRPTDARLDAAGAHGCRRVPNNGRLLTVP